MKTKPTSKFLKSDLVKSVKADLGCNDDESNRIIDSVFDALANAVAAGKETHLLNIGKIVGSYGKKGFSAEFTLSRSFSTKRVPKMKVVKRPVSIPDSVVEKLSMRKTS